MGTKSFPIVVTSYEIIIADAKHLARHQWKYIVVDEGHRLKNFNCKLLRELRTIPTNNKLLLSGELGLSFSQHPCSLGLSLQTASKAVNTDEPRSS